MKQRSSVSFYSHIKLLLLLPQTARKKFLTIAFPWKLNKKPQDQQERSLEAKKKETYKSL
jgi:hypothetical protein